MAWRTQEDFLAVASLLLLTRKQGIQQQTQHVLAAGSGGDTEPAETRRAAAGELTGDQLWGRLPLELVVYLFERFLPRTPPSFHWQSPVTPHAWYLHLPEPAPHDRIATTSDDYAQSSGYLNRATREALRRTRPNYVEVLVEQARGRSLSFGIAERSAQLSSIPIGGVGAKWKSWGWISRGLLYFNQPGRLVRGPELLTGESAWGYRQGDRVGIYVDLQRGVLAFFLNGRQIAPAHEDPDLASNLEPLYPTVSFGGRGYRMVLQQWVEIPALAADPLEPQRQSTPGQTARAPLSDFSAPTSLQSHESHNADLVTRST